MVEALDLIKENGWYLILLAILFTSLAVNLNVSLTEKIVFGDEGYYAVRGEYLAEQLRIPKYNSLFGERVAFKKLFREPPFLFFALSSFHMLGGRVGMRAFMPVISIISASMLFLLVRKLHSTKAGVFASLFYLTMPALITHTIFLYLEQLSLMFLISSVYFLYSYFESEGWKYLLLSGILLGFSILSEQVSLVFLLVYAIVFFLYKTSWRNWFKEVLSIFLLVFLVMSPWMLAHNLVRTGGLGFKIESMANKIPGVDIQVKTEETLKELPQAETKGLKSAAETGRGTSAPIAKYGILNYTQFAYTLPLFLFAVLGFSYYFIDLRNKYWIFILWTLTIFVAAYFLMARGRVEDLSRNSLLVIVPLSAAAGYFGSKVYDYLGSFKSVGKTVSILFALVLLGWCFFSASAKAESLRPIKQFSSAFYKGCDWIRENTEEDTLIYTFWGHRAEYHCKRTPIGNGAPSMADALLKANNYTYKVFKGHEIDYLFIQKFSIKRGRENGYPVDFVRYIEKNPHYRKVYSYPRQCLYRQKISDCVVVYEFLTEKELGEGKTAQQQEIVSELQQMQGGA